MADVDNGEKKSMQVNVKMTESDFDLLQRAAARIWPQAIVSRAAMVLGLAKMAAKRIVGRRR